VTGCQYWVWNDPARPERCGVTVEFSVVQNGLPPMDFPQGRTEFKFCATHARLAEKRGGEVSHA
jgi:hypothetical protein